MNIKKINLEKTIEYLFYLLILLYFVGKVFKAISFLIDVLFIIYIYFNKHLAIEFFNKYKSLIWSFILFASYLLIQSVLVDYTYLAFKSSFETIIYIILFFAAIFIFNNEEKIKRVIYVSFFILLIIAADSFYQYFTGFDVFGMPMYDGGTRITAWSHASKVSLMMGEFFGLIIASIFLLKNKEKKFAIFMLLVVITLFVLAGNRSPILALFSAFIFVSLFSVYKKYLFGILGVFILLFAFAFTNEKIAPHYAKLLNPTTNEATSHRLAIYLAAAEIVKEKPILGIGSHNYKYYHSEYIKKVDWEKYKKYYSEYFYNNTSSHVHSVAIDMIVSYGLLGIIFFFYVLYNIYKSFIKNNSIGWIASIGFIYCITPFQFGRNFTMGDWQFITYLGLIFLALMSIYNVILEKRKLNNEK